MPVFLILTFSLLVTALLLAFRSSGRKRWLAWGNFALLALPLLIAGVGGLLLSSNGLAWRSCVKLPCGLVFVAGILLLLVRAGAFLWRRCADWSPAAQTVGQIFVILVIGFFCLVIGWYGLLFSAIWAGQDRVVERDGQVCVEEHVWMDSDFYAYSDCFGPLVRGKDILHMG
ncbi:MAG: hypothetical protein HDT14_07290 [Oscillibacter sp.]|nr:hypothetical protein [Oscillibacter sp.]